MFAKNVPQTGNTSSLPTCKDLWGLTVALAGTDPVSILMPQDRACTETGALCTADGQVLSTGLARRVPVVELEPLFNDGPVGMRTDIADSKVLDLYYMYSARVYPMENF